MSAPGQACLSLRVAILEPSHVSSGCCDVIECLVCVCVDTVVGVQEELESRGFVKAYFDFAEHIGSSTRAFIRESKGTRE